MTTFKATFNFCLESHTACVSIQFQAELHKKHTGSVWDLRMGVLTMSKLYTLISWHHWNFQLIEHNESMSVGVNIPNAW